MGGKKAGVMREREMVVRETVGGSREDGFPVRKENVGGKRESVGGEGADGRGKYGQEERRCGESPREDDSGRIRKVYI